MEALSSELVDINVAILTEGGDGIGWGHINRQTSVYSALKKNSINPDFFVNYQGIVKECNFFDVKDWREQFVQGYDIVFIDSYLAEKPIYEALKEKNKLLVCFDDFNRIEYPAGIIVNGAFLSEEILYVDDQKLLLGSQFFPLRDVFWDLPHRNNRDQVKKVLVTFGGEDKQKLSRTVAEFLLDKGFEVNVVLGPSNTDFDYFKRILNKNLLVYHNLNAEEMLALMIESDVAVSAGGQTIYELAASGTPAIIIGVADNQKNNVYNWQKSGLIFNEIWLNDTKWFQIFQQDFFRLLDLHVRKEISKISQIHVDGKGSLRIVKEVIKRFKEISGL